MNRGATHSRRTNTVTCRYGKVLTRNYGSGLTSLSSGGTTLESYSYLGLGTVVVRAHPQPGIDYTCIKQSGENNGEAGDQYIGLEIGPRIRQFNASSADQRVKCRMA